MAAGRIVKVSGPLIVAEGMVEARMFEVARVSDKKLIGEVIELHGDQAYIQVYEDTSGLGPGEEVESTGQALSIELGPGLLQSIYDGIQRPLDVIYGQTGHYITRGINVPGLDRKRKWDFVPNDELKKGEEVEAGDLLGKIQETELIVHRVMVPPLVKKGTLVKKPEKGSYHIEETIAEIKTDDGHNWDQGIFQGMPGDDDKPRHSFGFGGAHIVFTQDFQH